MNSLSTNIRNDFPALARNEKGGKPLVYLDSAATALKPDIVIDSLSAFYRHDYSNIHRGLYDLSGRASLAFDNVRDIAKAFINAKSAHEIIFTRNGTEGFNLLAHCLGESWIKPNSQIIVSDMEHHANLVPWQVSAKKAKATLVSVPLQATGDLDLEAYKRLLRQPTSIVAITAVSNVLGVVNPLNEIISLAKQANALTVIDAAQMAPHMPIDVQALDCDFLSISGHKCYGPSGASFVYGKLALLENLPPYQTGGGMIEQVFIGHATYAKVPEKFEAGTPAITEVIGMGVALNYMMRLGMDAVYQHEQALLVDLVNKLKALPFINILADPKQRSGLVSFNIKDIHPHDVASLLNDENIAVRAGHHCAMPLHLALNIDASVRASFGIYNVIEDNDRLIEGLTKIATLFGVT